MAAITQCRSEKTTMDAVLGLADGGPGRSRGMKWKLEWL